MSATSNAKELKKKLCYTTRHIAKTLSEEEKRECEEFSEGYKGFLNEAKTERESVAFAVKEALAHGFTEFDRAATYRPGDKVYVVNRGCGIALAVIGKCGVRKGVKMAISHIDSPRLDLKPNPLYESDEIAYFKTHYYGGIKKYQWPTIPLSLHGRVAKKDGTFVDVRYGDDESEPCFFISDLLPHLSRDQDAKAMRNGIDGEQLNVIVGSLPVDGSDDSELVKLNVLRILDEKYGVAEADFTTSSLEVVPATKARDVGFDRSMIGGYGQDDHSCAYPALRALLSCGVPEKTVITMLTDKEEIGSTGNTGMDSRFLKYFIADLAAMDGVKTRHVLSVSKCLSADVNSCYDPTFASVFEKANSAHLNKGVVLTKYTGSGGKSSASDANAEFLAEVARVFDNGGVVWQIGELGKVDAGGGGTISKFIAKYNVDVVDVGVPVLAMHAPFELIAKTDLFMTFKAIRAFLTDDSI